MALETVQAPGKGRGDDRDRVPVEIPRDRWKRPLIVPVGGGQPVAYTRASTLGKALEDDSAISRWKVRVALWGASRREDVLLGLKGIPSTEAKADKAAIDELAELAMDSGGAGSKARVGTALHALIERVDRGLPIPDVGEHQRAIDAYRRLMAGRFRVVASETFVVNDRLKAAGTFDDLLETERWEQPCDATGKPIGDPLPPGTRLVGDKKTAQSADYFGIGFAVQKVTYRDGEPYDPARGGRLGWPDGIAPHPDWSVIVHVPSGGASADLYWVDLRRGRELADLAVRVRAERSAARSLIVRAQVEPWPEPSALAALVAKEDPVVAAAFPGAVVTSPTPVLAPAADTFAGQVFAHVKAYTDAHRLLEAIRRVGEDTGATERTLFDLYETNARIWRAEHGAAADAARAAILARGPQAVAS